MEFQEIENISKKSLIHRLNIELKYPSNLTFRRKKDQKLPSNLIIQKFPIQVEIISNFSSFLLSNKSNFILYMEKKEKENFQFQGN